MSWNVIIGGIAHSEKFDEALRILHQMKFISVKLDLDTLSILFLAHSNLVALAQVIEIHRDGINNNFELDVFVGS